MKEKISQNRNLIMGLSILWIALYHIPNHSTIPVLGYLQDIGYGGVDFFIFLSGFGSYYSLSKRDTQRDGRIDALGFYLRRMKRILPSYFIFMLAWLPITHFLIKNICFTELMGNLTLTGWWNNDQQQFNWFVDCLVLFYLLAPFIYQAIESSKKKILTVSVLLVIAFMVGMSFMHGQLIIAMSRLPLFVLGFAFAGVKCRLTDGRLACVLWNVVMIIGWGAMYIFMHQDRINNWHYGTFWYPFFLIVPGMIIDISYLGSFLEKFRIFELIKKGISELGKASFEIFLWHLIIFETFLRKASTNWMGWLGLYLAGFTLGYLFYLLNKALNQRFGRRCG